MQFLLILWELGLFLPIALQTQGTADAILNLQAVVDPRGGEGEIILRGLGRCAESPVRTGAGHRHCVACAKHAKRIPIGMAPRILPRIKV